MSRAHRHGNGPLHVHGEHGHQPSGKDLEAPVRLAPAGRGHNGPRPTTQWQTLHESHAAPHNDHPHDLDLVEASFIEGFGQASDVTSFLRLAGIAFVGQDAEGRTLRLLRVEFDDITDVATLTPLLGGAGRRYDPLPARFTSRRRLLSFAYFDGDGVRSLDFAAARALIDITPH